MTEDSDLKDPHLDNDEMVVTDDAVPADGPPGRRGAAYIVGGIVALSVILLGSYLYLSRQRSVETPAETKEEIVVSVKVVTAEKDTIALESAAVGTIVPAEQSTVAAGISAQIRQMGILKNSLVKKGDVLAVLSSEDLVAQRNEAQAALDEARLNLQTLETVTIPQTRSQTDKDLSDTKAAYDNARATAERRRVLYEKGGISLKELEASQLAMTNAENAYRLARQNAALNTNAVNPNAAAIARSKIKQAGDRLAALDVQARRGEVRAPISGIVTDQFQYEGEFASQGARLVTIAEISSVIVKAQFADTVVKDLKVGDMVTIKPAETPDEPMTAKVTLISRSSDTQSRTVEVWATFGNPRGLLLAGGAVQMVVSSQPTDDAVVVPAAAVTLEASNADEGIVMVVDKDSIAHETKVKTGIRQGGRIQIVEGLEGGETVVIEGNYSLPDGTKVEIAKDEDETEKE